MNGAVWLFYPGLFVASLVGAAVGAYFKRRAENLATHDDLDKLVAQMAAVTETTENIKAAISDDVWDRQKQWEMRRDTVFESMRALGELDCALVDLQSKNLTQIPKSDELKQDRSSRMKDIRMRFHACETKFNGTMFLTDVVVGEGLSNALLECDKEMRSIATKIIAGDTAYFAENEVIASLVYKRDAVKLAARKELKLENAAGCNPGRY
jgi:hypothetical protein